jgi:hypothetical protein
MLSIQWQSLRALTRNEIAMLVASQRSDRPKQFSVAAAAGCGLPMALGAFLELPPYRFVMGGRQVVLPPPRTCLRHGIPVIMSFASVMAASYAFGLAGNTVPQQQPF